MFFDSSGYTSFFFMLRMVVTSRWRSGWRHRAISTRSAGGKRMPKTYCWNCASKLQSMAIATCITYVFPNSLRQTLWASMKWRFWIRLGESIRKHLRSLRLPPPPKTMLPMCFVGGVWMIETSWPRGMPTLSWGEAGVSTDQKYDKVFPNWFP